MRSISSGALTKLQTRLGTEPVVIIGIAWAPGGGYSLYADRDIEDKVAGKILEVSGLDDVVAVSDNDSSQEISVTLDDTDGSLKAILNSSDIHKRDVYVMQWFDGLELSDSFLLFKGQINSPIVWSEGDRTLSLSVVSQLEEKEFGFSPEEGEFDFIPADLIGQAWPSIFGTATNVPAVRIGEAIHGTTLDGVGVITGVGQTGDGGVGAVIENTASGSAAANLQKQHISYVASAWSWVDSDIYDKLNDQRSAISAQIANAAGQALAGVASAVAEAQVEINTVLNADVGPDEIRILGGEFFPRGEITLQIGGGTFVGKFGDTDTTDDLFEIYERSHTEDAREYDAEVAAATKSVTAGGTGGGSFDYINKVPCRPNCYYRTHGSIYAGGTSVSTTDPVIPKYTWIDAGSSVTLVGNEPITYIVSIVPGTVISVGAFKTFNGVKYFVEVPNNLYTVEDATYGTISVVQIVFDKTLSTIPDQNWGDDIYVSFQSSVGPNIIDILSYIISRYTSLSIDATSFASVRSSVGDLPANFAVLERKSVFSILQEIAFQACCNLRLVNGIFYITYLPAKPDAVDTITENDIQVNSLEISVTPTEDLVTKITANWCGDYAKPSNKIILRYNVAKYGIQEADYDFYIYNDGGLVQKAATFWIIRKGNTWKTIKFNTFINKLNLETFDCINLDFQTSYVSTESTPAIITSDTVDTNEYSIQLECWTPVRLGEMVEYDWSWPANVSALAIFPTNQEVAWGYAGGAGIGTGAGGTLPDAPKNGGQSYYGASGPTRPPQDKQSGRKLGLNSGYSDRGARNAAAAAADAEYLARMTRISTYRLGKKATTTVNTTKPVKPVKVGKAVKTYVEPIATKVLPQVTGDGLVIDLKKTKIVDAGKDQDTAYLADFLKLIDGQLHIKTDSLFVDASETNMAEFDFKFDDEGAVFGAGTAFLAEPS